MANLRVDKITSTETFETTGSVQFQLGGSDATRDRLTIASNSDFTTSGDFTIEAWIYPFSQVTGGTANSIFGIGDYDSSTGFLFYVKSDGLLSFYTGSDENNTTFKVNSSTWHHVALVRSGEAITIYADGKFLASYHYDNTFSGLAIIGGNSTNGSDSIGGFSGHISNVRYVNGRALYTENFKPPMRELEVVPGTVLLACQSKSDATLEKTGKTITTNNNAVASEFSPGLLTPIPKAGAGSAITGSVEFSGDSGYLTVPNTSDLRLADSDFTVEAYINFSNGATSNGVIVALWDNNNNQRSWNFYFDRSANVLYFAGSTNGSSGNNNVSGSIDIEDNNWYHVAACRSGSTIRLFVNGVELASNTSIGTYIDNTTDLVTIGAQNHDNPGFRWKGFISNLRIVKGTALYVDDFIPPTRELKKVPGAVLLCCQDSNDPTQEATGKTISLNGIFDNNDVISSGISTTPVSSNFTPQVGDDRKVTFEGVTKINTENYFYLPTGDTESREETGSYSAGTRGLFFGGQSGMINVIDYVTIASTGDAKDFGDLVSARMGARAGASQTRGVIVGGYPHPSPTVNTMEYVTIPSTGNTLDFGDLNYAPTYFTASSNSTRGITFGGTTDGGTPGANDTMDYFTIPSKGNARDFGNLGANNFYNASVASPTRAIQAGGGIHPAYYNLMEYVTIATTGNAKDFGDLNIIMSNHTGCSNSTRGLFGGGYAPGSPQIVSIVYTTIASMGNTFEFGDLTIGRSGLAACSSSNRGLFAAGVAASPISGNCNIIDYVTIATTSNALDFGDMNNAKNQVGGLSNGHGGLG